MMGVRAGRENTEKIQDDTAKSIMEIMKECLKETARMQEGVPEGSSKAYIMDIKKDCRKNFIEARNKLSAAEVHQKSAEIFNRVLNLSEYASAVIVLAYMSFGNEVETRPFIERCFRDGKRVALPRVMSYDGKCRSLAVFEIKSINEDLVPGFKGILEPNAAVLEMLEPEAVDMAVIPGVAFDKHCNRMGYGAGYYDRFLPKLRSGCLKTGVAFDIQLAGQIPTDEFDIRLDMVITESKIFGSR